MGLEDVPSPILIMGSIVCVLGGGLAAGLTIGIMSLDNVGLELLIESGDPKEASYARKLAPIRKKGNLLLVTLLLTNTVFNEVLPLLIDHIRGVSTAVALVLPTLTVMLFGEIIPQSICTRYGLVVGAHCVWLVRLLQLIFLPIAWPLAWVLDKVLGEELGNIYSHKQLKGLIDIHSHKRHGELTDVETTLLKGALDFSNKKAQDFMVPLKDVFMLEANERIDTETVSRIWQSGRSRIPVCDRERTNVIGMLFAKDLLVVRPEDCLPVRTVLTFYGQPVLRVWSDQHLDAIFTDFKSGKCHLSIVQRVNDGEDDKDPFYEPIGILTLEDVMEALIQDEILDENDEPDSHYKKLRPSISSFARKTKSTRLLPEQIAAITSYLSRTVEPFKPHKLPEQFLTRLIAKVGSTEVAQIEEKDYYLYTRGQLAGNFALVLNGRFEVLSGEEKIHTDMGPWCFLGLPAISNSSYRPDYTARLTTPTAQVLLVSYVDYQDVLRASAAASPVASPAPPSAIFVSHSPKDSFSHVDYENSPLADLAQPLMTLK